MHRNPDSQVGNCCRAIVRVIHARRLGAGTRLPPQDELRRNLGFSHNSLTPAMNLLTAAGMIARKRGAGTIVIDPTAEPPGLWRIGLALGLLDNSPAAGFGVYVGRFLHESIQRSGCHLRSYFLNYDKFDQLPHGLGDFSLLGVDIETGRLDALVTSACFSRAAWDDAARHGVVLGCIGGWSEVPLRIDMDTDDLLRQTGAIVRAAERRRLTVVAPEPQHRELATALAAELPKVAVNSLAGTGETDALTVAEALLAQPQAARPDALMVLNDNLTLALTSLLSRAGYAPLIVARTNEQIPLPYLLPVTAIEFDIAEFAATAVAAVLERVRRPDLPPTVTRLPGKARHLEPVGHAAM